MLLRLYGPFYAKLKENAKKCKNIWSYEEFVVSLQQNKIYCSKLKLQITYITIHFIDMSRTTIAKNLPRRAAQNLQIVGEQIRLARLRRDLSLAQIAERAMCNVITVMRVEKGSPTVSMGIYLRILFALGLDESILFIAKEDEMGRNLQDLDLKQRASKK